MKCDFTQNPKSMALRLQKPGVIRIAILLWTCLLLGTQAIAQTTVTGRVTDETGQGLPGVTVLLKGTSTAAPTNVEGNYSINVPDGNGTLIFSFIGYLTQEVPISNRSSINVSLRTDDKTLEEVVVIGYGTQRAEAVTGSVASISGEALTEVPSANISQALQGRLPGVELSQTSSQPGAPMQIRIRGTRSLTASNDPLVVLDGIPYPGSIGDINPNDIQSIDILKDASATAIYGSRGANGVILVTTKGGKAGQKPQVSYNTFTGIRTVFAKFPMMNGEEFAALRQAAGRYSNGIDESYDVDTDWQDLFYKTGVTTSHDLGVSGGTEQGRYNFSVGYYDESGVIPTQQYTRYSMRGSLDQGVGKHFRFGFSTYNNYNITQGSNIGLYGILSASPIANPYNADGTWKRVMNTGGDGDVWVNSRENVENLRDRWLSQTRAFGTYNTLFGEIQIPGVEGLKLRTNLGVNYRQSQGGAFTAAGINNVDPTTPSTASVSNQVTTDWTIENMLLYDRTFAEKHNVNVIGLYSASDNQMNRSRIAARDIPSDAFQFYNLGLADGEITVAPGDQWYTRSGLMSWMGRVMYSYDDRYLLSATLRSDASSRLAPGHKWHTYPAVSAGWNIGRESFMENLTVVNMLKLRAGFGVTSNQAVAPYATLGGLATRPYNFGDDNYQNGFFVSELPNPSLGWEFSETWNYGLDFSVLNHRLSGTIEYYTTNTKDILLRVPLPATSGVGSVIQNIGRTQNKGIELSLNGVILNNLNGWTWEAGVNMYANRNKLVALAGDQPRDEANWWFVGHPINVIYDYERIGLWQVGDPHMGLFEPGSTNPGDLNTTVGTIKVRYTGDYNDDGTPTRQISAADRQIIDVNPNFQGGFNTRVGFKGFDLSVVGVFQNGGILNSTLYGSSGYLNMLTGRRGNVKVDYWTPENTDAKYPNPRGFISGDNPRYGSTLGYFNASYMKIRTISLGYNFNKINWLQNAGVNNLRLYVTAQNPFVLFSPYNRETGMDPETNSYGNENAAVPLSDNLRRILTLGTNAPATRNFLVGLNVNF
ncbi:TonB-dependent receptor [Pontibacter sp. SGAir0037]|uniref:SusC/RagA family TonB-linked outer membrane protein n=1 Tax=Pontibacter sp. SGAir0037 TaxID=2571030 RepID=UPI0010CCF83E|nr:TonB-dependent receptor [Pontibacter sp. SGAir0037]QCR24314.1 SusC/RagA family protein [Pontibacter sp. SGAir0037]